MAGDVVSTFIDAIERKELDRALTLVTPDCQYDNVPFGPIFGVDGIRGVLAPFLDRWDEISWVVEHQVSSGSAEAGIVMNERRDRFRLGERWIELPVAGLFVLHDGRITLWRDYFDEGQYGRALTELG